MAKTREQIVYANHGICLTIAPAHFSGHPFAK